MRWEEHLLDVFEDLEQQAAGLAMAERDVEVAELSRAEYAQVSLADRLHGALGAAVVLEVAGIGPLAASVRRAGDGWLLAEQDDREWIVRTAALQGVRGLPVRALGSDHRPVTARLGLGSALRGVAAARDQVSLHRPDGSVRRGVLGRVGADFVELWAPADEEAIGALRSADARTPAEVVPFAALSAVRRG